MKLNGKLIFLLFASLLLRLVSLNQSLWLDETTTANVVRKFGYIDIITKFSPHDFHPPLFYLLMKSWTSIFGYSELSLRMPSVFASLITGIVVYKLAENLKLGKSLGLWASAFFLVNPLIVYYSQEARMYSLATLLITSAYWCVTRVSKGHNVRKVIMPLIGANICIALSLVSFYGSLFFIASLYMYLLIKKDFKLLAFLLPGSFLAGVLLYPLFIVQLKNSGEALRAMPNWSMTLGKANLKNLFLIPVKLTSGRISFDPKWLYYGIAGAWAGYIGFWLAQLRLQTKKFNEIFFHLKTPIFLGFVISFYKPLLQYFRFIYILPFLSILLAAATYRSRHRYVLLAGFLAFSLLYLFTPVFHREDWRSLVVSLPSKTVWTLPTAIDPVSYYDSKILVKDLRQLNTELNQIIIIPYASEIYGLNYERDLEKKGFRLSRQVTFRGLSYSIWTTRN